MILVNIESPKTGKSYICKSYSETIKGITYSYILRHKDHPFFKQFYHGLKEIEALEKPIWNTPIYKILELTITETPLDGRTRYAKQLPVFNADILAELTY